MDIAIRLTNLTRRFGATTAVDDVSLDVPAGSFFAFLGPNGAGKTTTVRMMTGLLEPTAGDVEILGHSIGSSLVDVKRCIGVVPDDLALFERLSLIEHLELAGRATDLDDAETALRSEDLLRFLELWDDRGTHAVDASTGMKKKLALALALIHNPRVLFLDEPFEGIDPVAGRRIRDLLLDLNRRGVTIFLTSHILEIVERLATRVAIISAGRVVRDTTLDALASEGHTLEDAFVAAVGRSAPTSGELSWLG